MPRIPTVRTGRDNDEEWHALWLNDHPYDISDYEAWVVLRAHLEDATATDLRNWMRNSGATAMFVSDDNEYSFDPDTAEIAHSIFELQEDQLSIRVDLHVRGNLSELPDDDMAAQLRRLLGPALSRKRMSLASAEWLGVNYAQLRLRFPNRGRTLLELSRSTDDLVALIRAVEGGGLDRASARDLALAGHLDVLIGQPEGRWLDAKVQLYDLGTSTGKLSLVSAVAAFSNGDEGGLIIFGLGTRNVDGGETISSFHPVPASQSDAVRLHKVIDQNLFPPPAAMKVWLIDGPGGKYVLIDIPPQDEELKPFLVHGAIVEGKYYGAYISIVTRRDEWSIPTRAESIHSTIAAGRALLRGSKS